MRAEHTMLNYRTFCKVTSLVLLRGSAPLVFFCGVVFFFALIKKQSYLNQNMFLKFKNATYKIHPLFSEAWGGILGNVRSIISKWFMKRIHMQQHLGLSLFHSEVLCKASTKR